MKCNLTIGLGWVERPTVSRLAACGRLIRAASVCLSVYSSGIYIDLQHMHTYAYICTYVVEALTMAMKGSAAAIDQ